MAGHVNMFTCLLVLGVIGPAFPLPPALNLDETFTKSFSVTPTYDETRAEKPVNLQYPSAVLFSHTCGGTIISPTWILTAAHCTISPFGLEILAGTNNTGDGSGTIFRVKRKVIHPYFMVGPYWLNARQYNLKQVTAEYDFLLVELEKPLPLDGITMKAAKLNRNYNLAPGTKVSFAGYGADEHQGVMNSIMHIRKFELLSTKECASVQGYKPEDMICAQGTAPNYDSACNGDSGSGLMDENGVLVGVTSWVQDDAIECHKDAIVYFAKVAAVRKWIYKVTKV